MDAVAFYISGHGFGHASRQIEIINALGAASPSTRLVIRSAAASWLFDRTLRVPADLLPGDCDTGVVQFDSLHLDADATIDRAAAFYSTLGERADREAALLQQHGISLVIADAPPLACGAAAAAGIPAVVAANFTWDWIYQAYQPEISRAPTLLATLHDAYATAAAGWRLPMHGGFETIVPLIDVPFVARHARRSAEEVREVCGLPPGRPVALLSFGGYGVRDIDVAHLDCLDDYVVMMTHDGTFDGDLPAGVVTVAELSIYGAGLRYEDIVAAVDVVVSKPGYGIISECVANRTALVYTSRGRFAEYEVLVAEMPRFLRCSYIDQRDLFGGRWKEALTRALDAPPPPEMPATNGAEVIAEMVLAADI